MRRGAVQRCVCLTQAYPPAWVASHGLPGRGCGAGLRRWTASRVKPWEIVQLTCQRQPVSVKVSCLQRWLKCWVGYRYRSARVMYSTKNGSHVVG